MRPHNLLLTFYPRCDSLTETVAQFNPAYEAADGYLAVGGSDDASQNTGGVDRAATFVQDGFVLPRAPEQGYVNDDIVARALANGDGNANTADDMGGHTYADFGNGAPKAFHASTQLPVSSTPAMDTIVAAGAILPTRPDYEEFDAVAAGLGRGSSLAGGKQGAVVGQAGAPSHDYAEMDALRAVPPDGPTHETKPARAGTTGQTSTYGPMDPKLAYAHKGQVEREKNLFGEDIRAQDASPAAASSATQRKTPMSAAGGGAPQQAGTLYSLNPGEDQGTAQAVRFAPESATADPVTLAQGNTASEVYAEADLSRDGAGNVVNEAVYDDMHQERIPGAPVDDAT